MTWKITGAPGTGDDLLYSQAGTPTLDLRFASSKSLNDNVSGQNLIDFTRGGNGIGTYVGSDGLIKNSVINYYTYSETFSAAPWGTGRASKAVSTVLSPDGISFAIKVTEDGTASNTHYLAAFSTVAFTAGVTYTQSLYVKAGERSRFHMSLPSAAFGGVEQRVLFNLTTGVPTLQSGTATSSMVPEANGWYRCSMTAQATATTTTSVILVYLDNGTSYTYSGDNASGLYVWGAQLEQSSTVGEYVKTTSSISGAPRFDHDPATGESLGLLIEETRQNALIYSQDFTQSNWTANSTAARVTSTGIDDPSGGTSASTWENQGAGGLIHRAISGTSGVPYTYSIWIRRRSGTGSISMTVGDNAPQDVTAQVGATWKRISVTSTPTTTTLRAYVTLNTTGDQIDIWGAQLEQGAFSTSYIPTGASGVTRNADVAQITGSNFSRWYSQSQGTVFTSQKTFATEAQPGAYWFQKTGTAGRGISMSFDTRDAAQRLSCLIRDDVSQGSVAVAGLVDNAQQNATHAWSGGTASVALNTALGTGSYNAIYPGIDLFSIGYTQISAGSPAYLNGTIRRLCFFDRRLPNATLQAITS